MNKCLNCEKELVMTVGRRAKKFCKSSCRAAYHQKKNGGKPRWVSIEKYNELLAKVKETNNPENKEMILAERDATPIESDFRQYPLLEKDTEGQIEVWRQRVIEIENELKKPPTNPMIGQKKWILIREKELRELNEKLINNAYHDQYSDAGIAATATE